jgi:hypothetical protein
MRCPTCHCSDIRVTDVVLAFDLSVGKVTLQ